MAEVRRLPVLAFLTCALVVAGVAARPAPTGKSATALAQVASEAPRQALSSSWYCAGATLPGGEAPGELVLYNAGAKVVDASVRLVSLSGPGAEMTLTVSSGTTQVVREQLPPAAGGAPGRWVGALVTVYGGTASVSQVVGTPAGTASQPCASSASAQWYFPDGAAMRNASDEISLLNPYPVDVVADLSFTTELGLEQPSAFRGVVVPARGLTVLDLGAHLRRREHIAVTVTTRGGEVVAFETEVVTQPPAGAPRVGAPETQNPVEPEAGVELELGAPQVSESWWWPDGSESPGLTEKYVVYNPGSSAAQLSLSLLASGGGGGLGSSTELNVGPYGTAVVTTNGQSWALPGIAYATHLQSLNGVAVVAERSLTAEAPSPYRGIAALLGEAAPARQWLVAPSVQVLAPYVWLEVVNPGDKPALLSVQSVALRRLVPVPGLADLVVAPGGRAEEELAGTDAGQVLVMSSSQPVLVERDSYAASPAPGINLAPAVVLGGPG